MGLNPADNSYINYSAMLGEITNSGAFWKNGGSWSTVYQPFVNMTGGIIHVATGTLSMAGTLAQQGAVRLVAGTTLQRSGGFTNNGTLHGAGTIDVGGGEVFNSGTLAPGTSPGILSVAGNFTQTVAGAVSLEIGGTAPGTNYDRLAISGNAGMGGALNVSLVSGYTPSGGEIFTLLTHGSRGGAFAAMNLPPPPAGLRWQVYQGTNVLQLFTDPVQTTGGVLTAWYRLYGAGPAENEPWTQEQWNALDGQDPDHDLDTNWREYMADTDPLDSNDWFHIVGAGMSSPVTLRFQSSTSRVYTLHAVPGLLNNSWTNVAGQGPRPGVGGTDSMTDTNASSGLRFHRLGVAVP